MIAGSSVVAVAASFDQFAKAIDECRAVIERIASGYNSYVAGPPCSAMAARLRINRHTGAFNAANMPEAVLDDIDAALIKAGDHHDAFTLARDRLHARIDRAADTAMSGFRTLAHGIDRLPACRNASVNRSVRGMYLATMHRELPAAVRRTVRGQ